MNGKTRLPGEHMTIGLVDFVEGEEGSKMFSQLSSNRLGLIRDVRPGTNFNHCHEFK